MQDYIEAYNNALKDLYTALNSRSPTCWKTVFFELLLFSRYLVLVDVSDLLHLQNNEERIQQAGSRHHWRGEWHISRSSSLYNSPQTQQGVLVANAAVYDPSQL